jgi:hypothetical protein
MQQSEKQVKTFHLLNAHLRFKKFDERCPLGGVRRDVQNLQGYRKSLHFFEFSLVELFVTVLEFVQLVEDPY